MTPSIRDASLAIKLKVRELQAQLATLTATLTILTGKRTELPSDNSDDAPKKLQRQSRQHEFDAMMSVLSAHKGRSLKSSQLREELEAKGQLDNADKSLIYKHLARAVKLGYVLKRADGYRVSQTIQKITQKAAPKPSQARRVNGVAAPKLARPGNYAFVLDALRAADGPQRGSAVQAAANKLGATSWPNDTSVYGFLERAVKAGLAKKSAQGYQITKKGSAVEAPLGVTHGATEI